MDESQLQVFIDGTKHYFRQVSRQAAEVGVPYLADDEAGQTAAGFRSYDYTGVIGISGEHSGCVYYSAPAALLKGLLAALGESDTGPANQADLVGEVANTISGNARKVLGSKFVISVPTVVPGPLSGRGLPRALRSFVIPITWQRHASTLVISLT